MVNACPECEASAIKPRPGGYGLPKQRHDERWRCEECGALFGDPVERESETGAAAAPTSGPAKRLLDMDPDEWPPEEGDA